MLATKSRKIRLEITNDIIQRILGIEPIPQCRREIIHFRFSILSYFSALGKIGVAQENAAIITKQFKNL
jgi:hypothetical protein